MTGTDRRAFPDCLLASSVNGGGVFVVRDGGIERISPVDTTGIAAFDGGYYWARQAEGVAVVRRIRGASVEPIELTRESLDLHDVLCHGGLLYVVATQTNTVFELQQDTVAETRRWTLPGEPDSQHLNSVCRHLGRLLASRFGDFHDHRGYKGRTAGAGEVIDLESGDVVIAGLSQPHSLHSIEGRLWLCNSEAHAVHVYRDFALEHEIPVDGYPRGLAFGVDHVYVGVSRSRNDPASGGSAGIASYRRDTLDPCGWMDFPADEVYDLVLCEGDPDALYLAGLRDTLIEADDLRHQRNLSAAQHHHNLQRILALEEALRVSGDTVREREAGADAVRAELHAAQDRLEESVIWADLLHDHGGVLHGRLVAAEARCAILADAFDAMRQSRSWKLTRPLRRVGGSDASDMLSAVEIAGPVADPVPVPVAPDRALVPVVGLAFVEHAEPCVSIIVTAYGQFAQTLACLHAIRRAGDATSYEVILVEDCSGDPEMARFAHVPGLRYVANDRNFGYLRSINRAAGTARGQYLHLLNNDTEVRPGWLDALVSSFALFGACGMVGSKLVNTDGTLQEAGGIVWSDGDACNYGRGDDPALAQYQVVREVDYVSGASLLLPTALFGELGGFDERYVPAYYEDTDLAFRVRAAGRRVYVQPASVVVHHEGLSHGTDIGSGAKASQVINRAVFHERWRDVLEAGHMAPGEHPFLARDRAQLGRIVLVMDRHPPQPDRDAGSRAIWQLMRVLHLHGFTVKFWADGAGAAPGYGEALQRHGIELLDHGSNGDFAAWLLAHGPYIDHVVLSRPGTAERYIDTVRRMSGATVTYYGHDIHHQRIGRQGVLEDDPTLRLQAAHLREIERTLWSAADLVLYPSAEETAEVEDVLAAAGARGIARTVPLYAYEAGSPLAPGGRPGPERSLLLFVGGFGHLPNADAVLWFVGAVWPLLAQRHPGLVLCLAGGGAGEQILALADARVEVAGHVAESTLQALYRRTRVAIAPLRFGAGIKGKVIEALWHGVPCVTTSTGQQGLADALALHVADEPDEMAAAISRLVDDDTAWWDASVAGRAYVAARFTVAGVWDALREVLGSVPPPRDVAERRAQLARAASREP